jgi:2'-5' RNA ligase
MRMNKYNIALIPIDHSERFIHYAKDITSYVKPDKYLISEHAIPHITLCHFMVKESEIDAIWQQTEKIHPRTIDLIFNELRWMTMPSHPKWQGVYWLFLIPNQSTQLHKLHLDVAKIVQPTNRINGEYFPHLTLMNTCSNEKAIDSSLVNPPLKSRFAIVLGASDSVGQLTTILFQDS